MDTVLWAYRLTKITAAELSHHHPTKICFWVIEALLAASILAGEVSSRASSGAFMCCAGKALSKKKKACGVEPNISTVLVEASYPSSVATGEVIFAVSGS